MRYPIEKQIKTLGAVLHGIGVLVVCGSLCAYFWFVWKPLADRRELCQQRITQLQQMLKRAPQVRNDNASYTAELASLKKSIEETQKRLPKELREHEFLQEARVAATQCGVELVDYQIGAIEELESYSKARLAFQCRGSFASICQFLDKIDHLPRITEVASLQIESADNFGRYPLQVTFILYFGGSSHDRTRRGDVL